MYVSLYEYGLLSKSVSIPDSDIEKMLKRAENDINSLTFNRIRKIGFDNLTDFQKEMVRQAVVDHADFIFEYGDMLTNPLSSFGINCVSMAWDNSKVQFKENIYTSNGVLSLLDQTGLTYLGVR